MSASLVQFGVNTTAEIRHLYLWQKPWGHFRRDLLVQFGVNTTAEIRHLYL